tara:strand:- start:651 stop:977 length:327 start_codon:yes stop_codon:yes gene_type:complete
MTTMISTESINTYDYQSPNHKPPFANCLCYNIKASDNEEVMKIAVGKKGCNFCRITEQHNIPYIFHNKTENIIEFWCPMNKYYDVKHSLLNQLNWANNIFKKNNIQKT